VAQEKEKQLAHFRRAADSTDEKDGQAQHNSLKLKR